MGSDLLRQFSESMADVWQTARRGLVQITDDSRGSIGAGTIWHSEGLIVTNAHVVAPERFQRGYGRPMRASGSRSLRVILPDGGEYPAHLLATDEQQDLAALAINANGLPTFELGDSRHLRPGQWVMALGHPWGVKESVTAGTIIGAGAQLPELPPGREWIALGLRLRPGHSGGALLDTDGRLIGINTMITGPEVGFAIPAHLAAQFLKERLGSGATV